MITDGRVDGGRLAEGGLWLREEGKPFGGVEAHWYLQEVTGRQCSDSELMDEAHGTFQVS